ncbi:MAG: hypothetical protein JNK82_22305 [Myxococcaceae bacterium]|nr:hypothetical protein [Myxococcaceae bacterium]
MSTPPLPVPPHLAGALAQVEQVIEAVEKKKVDLLTAPWVEIEKSIIKLLGGPFQPNVPEHQMIALGLAAAFGARLAKENGAFWFPSREAPEGAAMGFPEALVMLSPFAAVLEALAMSKLERLDEVSKEIRNSVAGVKFSGAGAQRLSPLDYQSLFDPGYVQLLAIDKAKLDGAFALAPDRLSIDLREALTRARQLPEQAKKQLEQQLAGSLGRLERGKPMVEQIAKAPRLGELVAHVFAATATTGSAPEELFTDVVFPLLFVGTPDKFPDLDGEELELVKQGIDPFVLFLEVTPYTYKAAEEGLMGAFPGDSLELLHPALAASAQPRLIKVSLATLKEPLEKFDAAKTKEAIARFSKQLEEKIGAAPKTQPQATEMLEAALAIIGDLKKIAAGPNQIVAVRRLTEAEASSDLALVPVRQALQGPRIILA